MVEREFVTNNQRKRNPMSRAKPGISCINQYGGRIGPLACIFLFLFCPASLLPLHLDAAPSTPVAAQSGAKEGASPPDASSSQRASRIFEEAVIARGNNNLKAARQGFEKLVFTYADTQQALDSYLYLGEIYEKQNLLYEASAVYHQLVERYPDHQSVPEALFRQGEISYRLGEMKKAQKIFKQILFQYSTTSFAPKAAFRLGDCLVESENMTSAGIYYHEGMEKLPQYIEDHPKTAFNIGSIYLQEKRLDQALAVFLSLEKNHPKFEALDKAVTFCGDIYSEQGKIAEAILAYQRVIDNYPDSIGAQVSQIRMADLGIEHPKMVIKGSTSPLSAFRNPVAAYRELMKRKTTDPVLAHLAEYKLGLALQKKGEHGEAMAVFRSLLAKSPKENIYQDSLYALKEEMVNYLSQRFQQKDYLEVIKFYEKNKDVVDSFLHQEKAPLPYFRIAQSYQNLKFYPPAIHLYRETQAILPPGVNPLSGQINFQLGLIFFQTADYQKAMQALQEIVSQPDSSGLAFFALSLMGDISWEKKDYQAALGHYQASLNVRPPHKGIRQLFRVGQCFEKLGKTSEAIESFAKAIDLANQEKNLQYLPEISVHLADCQFKAHKYAEALASYQKAESLALKPEDRDWVLYQIGSCSLKEAKSETARDVFGKIKAAHQDPIWPVVVDFKEEESGVRRQESGESGQ
ncbi:MAG: tetratricopeptide repeat protein [bacterium]